MGARRGWAVARLCLPVLLCLLLAPQACESKKVDPTELHGVFDRSARPARADAAPASGSAASRRRPSTPQTKPPELSRPAVAGPCIQTAGKPAARGRPAGRPACRRADVLEYADANGTPRYGCVFSPRDLEKRTPLPLLVFFHGEGDDATAVHRKTKLRRRYHKTDLSGDPRRRGFIILAPQGRRLEKTSWLRFDTAHVAVDNVDLETVDHFVDELQKKGMIDPRQVYAAGHGRGGEMATLYAMLRPDRIAAFATFGSNGARFKWSCATPPPPAAILYRACDTMTPCADVEQWLQAREDARAPTWSLRMGATRKAEPTCVLSKRRCRPKKGKINHNRWPKSREKEMLEYLGRFSLKLKTPNLRTPNLNTP